MSSIYVIEPPTKGKVILNTTFGPLDIELWPKEAPKATRNFVQLCLEGYFDNTIFHRVIPGFLVQGGDPTGTGTGGESIYGSPFADEFHSRLRFNHRGIVACANAGSPHSNGSQFFFSLDKCDFLDKKHTIFGKVTGDSVFNLLELGQVETDKDDRPLDPAPRIKSVEVLWNPFDDIVPRESIKHPSESVTDTENKDVKKKAVKQLNLLSFGEEAEEEEKEIAAVKQKIKSSHDVLDDPRLLKNKEPDAAEAKATREIQLSVRETLNSKKDIFRKDSEAESSNSDDGDDDAFDARMRRKVLAKKKELGDFPSLHKQKEHGESAVSNDHQASVPRSNNKSKDDQPRVEKLLLKKGIGSEARADRIANADVDLQLMGESERGRQLQKQKKRRLQGREDEVLGKLEKFKKAKFKKALSGKDNASTIEPGGAEREDLSDWTTVRLKFAPELGKDRMSRNDDPNDYVVHDPLLEKGKEKFNRMQAKQKRRDREWAGKSLT